MTDPAAREREIGEILDAWDWSRGDCLIGGYAVAAYGKPRYSRDLDFLIGKEREGTVLEYLHSLGFRLRPVHRPHRKDVFLDAPSLKRGDVSIDLMVGYVKDKRTQVVLPGRWLSDRARERRLILVTHSTNKPIHVCRPEALWALKLLAGRDQDLSDLFAIAEEPVSVPEVTEFLATIRNSALDARLEDEGHRLRTKKIFADSLSARFLPIDSVSARALWNRFVHLFSRITSVSVS